MLIPQRAVQLCQGEHARPAPSVRPMRPTIFNAWPVRGGAELPRPPLRCDDPADPMQRALEGDA